MGISQAKFFHTLLATGIALYNGQPLRSQVQSNSFDITVSPDG
jgi:hypothetical protein